MKKSELRDRLEKAGSLEVKRAIEAMAVREERVRAAYDRLRDQFAAQIASGLTVGTDLVRSGHFPDHAVAAKFCYDAADALVKEKMARDAERESDA